MLQQQQPIKDAVNNAFDQSPVAQNELDPELVRQVTEQVIRNLQTASLATPTASVQPQQTSYAPPPAQPVARSPTLSSTGSIPRRYTPPSPEKGEDRDESSYASSSPDPAQSDHDSVYSRESKRSDASSRSRGTPRPIPTDGTGEMRRSNTTSGRPRDAGSEDDRPRRRGSVSKPTTRDQSRPFRRDSKDSESDYHELPSRSRARPPRVPSDVQEATTLEKIWQPLFDNGNPTMRLSQFLRGLALHLIDDYEPKGSLVVTPAKMLRFFNEVKVADEFYPWDVIFGTKMPSMSLSKMYQKLLCQHLLVQNQHHEVPYIPGLTPSGFEQLMTCLIQAHPEKEFERLAGAVMNMPISNADDKSERFPKTLSRRLLPSQSNMQAEQRMIASLNHEAALVQLRGVSSMPPPPPQSAPPQQSSFTGRERKPSAQTAQSNAVDDEDLLQPSIPLERERKPYYAKEGMGKKYGTENDRERDNRPPTSQYRADGPPPTIRSSRSNSGVPTQSSFNNSASDPVNIPPSRGHRMSVNQGPPPSMLNGGQGGMNSMSGSLPKAGRRTPPPRNYARTDPLDVSGIPSSQYASNLHSDYAPSPRDRYAGDPDEDTLRRHHNRRPTERSSTNGMSANNNEDDPSSGRGYPIPPRPPPSAQGYDPSYGTTGGPPAGSYPRNGFFADGRRSTWYGASNMGPSAAGGAGGSDGYGSFSGNGGSAYPNQQLYGSSAAQH